MYAVTVTFKLHPGAMAEFLPLMRANARESLLVEPGCEQFDICLGDIPDTVFLYEIYADRAAFDLHLISAHFKSFDAAVTHLVAEKDGRCFNEVIR
ncbi:Quinol monooxygenase YgiN [Epibacterium ulvae]|uniref:Quinol monooxygenase YgiN n=1 Tax=Epibacterium ulvae TaxID=1156985 RepID=A0A1G5RAU1_9RHOB|nr:putative quinol monooxygenase [Epibacterium ulvae]SCZ70968.1 Quinol monooxygenase YgiN [Epibacterium ulvae]